MRIIIITINLGNLCAKWHKTYITSAVLVDVRHPWYVAVDTHELHAVQEEKHLTVGLGHALDLVLLLDRVAATQTGVRF